MRRTSHSCGLWIALACALLVAVAAPATAARSGQAVPSTAPDMRWRPRGDGVGAQAIWRAPLGDGGVTVRCDHGNPRLLLRIETSTLPAGLRQVTLVADSIGMDYPLERTDAGAYLSKIALDAPILDRMLVSRSFTLYGGGRAVRTGIPGDALARVVRACRSHHWPREARIDPSDAGLAKK